MTGNQNLIELFDFQKTGSLFLRQHKYAMLADEMGVGKTPQGIDAVRDLERVLVVCPAVAQYNWQEEFSRFGARYADVVADGAKPKFATSITSFNYLTHHLDWFTKIKWHAVIIDEAHMVKEPRADRTKAVLGKEGLLHKTDRLWALTGTPAPNHAGELWVWLYTFGYTTLSYDGFIARYCNSFHTDGHFGRVQIAGSNTKHTPELKLLLKRMALRRLKKDVLDLPPMFHNTFYIKGDTDAEVFKYAPDLREKLQREFAILNEKLGFGGATPTEDKLLSTLSLMSQSVSALRRYHGFKKVREVAELIKTEMELGLYNKIVIFGIHTDVLNLLEQYLTSVTKIVKVTGATPPRVRKSLQDRFQKEDDVGIFLGNIQAAGTNLTLTAANQVIFIEQDWVPGNNKQAADRTHRYGQTLSVNCRHVCIKDSIDSKIVGTLTRKIQEISTFID